MNPVSTCFVLAVLAAAAGSEGHAADAGTAADAVRRLTGLAPDEWRAVERGEAIARIMDTPAKHEVAVLGIATVRAARGCFVERFKDIERFKKSPMVLRIGKLPLPPERRDLNGFTLEPGDLESLRYCRVGSCGVKLSARTIDRLNRDVDWSGPNRPTEALAALREEIGSYLEAYLDKGNSALIEYHDKGRPERMEEQFRSLLAARPGVREIFPEFYEYLAAYPDKSLPGVEEFLYWSTEQFGLKPVVSITHVNIYRNAGQTLIASKQVYASHYFEASLGLAVAVDRPPELSPAGMYLIYMNRSRIDLLGGVFGGLRRALLRGRLRDGMTRNLRDVVRRLESECNGTPASPDFSR